MSHLSENCSNTNKEVVTYAKFTYIRFTARCATGKALDNEIINFTSQIPNHPCKLKQRFGSSIYEQLWNQKDEFPKLPIPVLLLLMTKKLIERKADQQQ
jgi:hypothetical protein